MVCENNLCVYWCVDKCILDEISIDSLGLCSMCIQVNLGEDILKPAREEFLKRTEPEF